MPPLLTADLAITQRSGLRAAGLALLTALPNHCCCAGPSITACSKGFSAGPIAALLPSLLL
jgi:hypothetical protein